RPRARPPGAFRQRVPRTQSAARDVRASAASASSCGLAPRSYCPDKTPQPKHQRRDLLTLAYEVLLRRLTGTREISHGLMPFVGYPDCGEFAGTRQLGQLDCVATVRLHPNAGFLRAREPPPRNRSRGF